MNYLSILLQQQGGVLGGSTGNILLIVLMIVVFYFFMIRPQQKRQKEIRKFQDSITTGTEVLTSGGIYGKVKEVKDKVLIIEIAENVRIKVEKSTVFAASSEMPQK
ncbi:MAG: preprotein translocase subunit YajC [Prevotellaceae bacterium]|jgi:preprotein translocase subunit YajC|nr:preprotein translocase subunit YajC [Prevotellaceae bacterium]